MNKIFPLVFITLAVAMHFGYCEWDFPDDLSQVGQSQNDRTIYFRSSTSYRQRTIPVKNVYLLAKPSSNREEAQFKGVVIPIVLVGGAILIIRTWKGCETVY